ncbi:MAG: sigma-70 family RNA polymerase sigma factor [Myxococcota bacterium]
MSDGVGDDFELLDRWRDGDNGAGDLLLRRHFAPLFRFFSNKAPEHADDLTQRTMLGCVEHRERFRGHSSFRTYLFVIARHQLYDYFRRKSRGTSAPDFSSLTLRALGTSPSSALARDEREEKLELALGDLPLEQQIALELAYRYELSGPEIAEVLEVEANTVRSRLARARKTLRTSLGRMGVEIEDFSRPLPS